MPDLVQPTSQLIPGATPDVSGQTISPGREIAASWRTGWGPKVWNRITASQHDPDPGFNAWDGIGGYEKYAQDLVYARSKAEQDDLKAMIDGRLRDDKLRGQGTWGIYADLMAGIADPTNLIPIPAVKGVGLVKGALTLGASFGAIAAGTEALRQYADPVTRAGTLAERGTEAFFNIGIGTLLGAAIGAPVGHWGASRVRAIRDIERGLSDVDNPNFAMPLNEGELGVEIRQQRPPQNIDGSYSRFKFADEVTGWEPKIGPDGIRYMSEDGITWVAASDVGRATPLSIGDDLAEHLGTPEPIMGRVFYADEVGSKNEFAAGQWHDRVSAWMPEGSRQAIDRVVLDGNDYHNLLSIKALWEERLPIREGESLADWDMRVGQKAMEEFRASKLTGNYSGPRGLDWILERLNFSPVVKGMNVFRGDNRFSHFLLGMGGDYNWATKANEFGWGQSESLLMRGLRHTVRWAEFRSEFDREWLRFVSGDPAAQGKTFQGLNMSAAGYALKQGMRRRGGANVLTYEEFSQMAGRATFDRSNFQVNGHAVNEYARNAARHYNRMMQEYDDIFRSLGMFRDQKTIANDIRHWTKERDYYQGRVMRWLFGQSEAPRAYHAAILVDTADGPKVFTGISHDAAIRNMIDTLGDDGVRLAEGPVRKGWHPREREASQRDAMAAPANEAVSFRRNLLKRLYDESDLTPEQQRVYDALPPDLRNVANELASLNRSMHGADTVGDAEIIKWIIEDSQRRIAELQPHLQQLYAEIDELRAPAREQTTADWEPEFVEIAGSRNPDLIYDDVLGSISDTAAALDHLKAQGFYTDLIDLIRAENEGVPLNVVDLEAWHADPNRDMFLASNIGGYDPAAHDIIVRGKGWPGMGANPEVIAHEAVHAASSRRLLKGIEDRKAGIASPYTEALDRLEAIRQAFNDAFEYGGLKTYINDLDHMQEAAFRTGHHEVNRSIQEMMSWGLTNPQMRNALRLIPSEQPRGFIKTKWDEFLAVILKLLGRETPTRAEFTQLDALLDLQDDMVTLRQPRHSRELRVGRAVEGDTSRFVDDAVMLQQREASLTPRQREIYEPIRASLTEAEEHIASLTDDLANATDRPHQFLDAAGNPEPYFNRFFDHIGIMAEREKFTRLITRWYERDNPDGARARAEITVDKILNGDGSEAAGPGTGALRPLEQRALNIPNSWTISDPELGDIAMADFIDTDLLRTSEHYMRKAGPRIEAARMYGDPDLKAEMARQRQYLTERYYTPQTTDEGRAAARAQVDEAMGYADITKRSVLGTLKTADPWRVDNRVASFLKDFATITSMGKVVITALPELMRNSMVNGVGNAFRATFMRYLDDLEGAGRENLAFNGLTGETVEMSLRHNNARMANMEQGESVGGPTRFERWLHERIPGYFKLNMLTEWTVWQKSLVGFTAQHAIMADVKTVAAALREGTAVDPRIRTRLAALGIKPRDALLLDTMPVQIRQGGQMILPSVDSWVGPDGRKARALLLNAIQGEMRRAIVTPSVGDKSTIFSGVWTRDGKVVGESDLMTVPMQFLGYGMGAYNKILVSGIQGRDRSPMAGIVTSILLGIMANYLKSSEAGWRAKSYDEIIFDGVEAAGLGGFWFGDLNSQIERFSNDRFGLRPLLGQDPKFGKKTDFEALGNDLGAGPAKFFDFYRAFSDPELSGSDRAKIIRRGIPYGNILYWDRMLNGMAGAIGGAFEGTRQ